MTTASLGHPASARESRACNARIASTSMPVGTTCTRPRLSSGTRERISSARSVEGATIAAQRAQKRRR